MTVVPPEVVAPLLIGIALSLAFVLAIVETFE
jgi:hypothetical protein